MPSESAELRCAEPGCSTLLSRYNHGDRCSLHEGAPAEASSDPLGQDCDGHARTVAWDPSLFSAGSKGARGVCCRRGCVSAATVAWFEGRFGARRWKAFCVLHAPLSDVELAAELLRSAAAAPASSPAGGPVCAACGAVVPAASQVRVLSPMRSPVTLHPGCADVEVLARFGVVSDGPSSAAASAPRPAATAVPVDG